jgi:hypothetical protein
MNNEDTKKRLQDMAVDNQMAGMLLALIERCAPNMQEQLLEQAAQSLSMADAITDKIKNDPEFLQEVMRRRQGG